MHPPSGRTLAIVNPAAKRQRCARGRFLEICILPLTKRLFSSSIFERRTHQGMQPTWRRLRPPMTPFSPSEETRSHSRSRPGTHENPSDPASDPGRLSVRKRERLCAHAGHETVGLRGIPSFSPPSGAWLTWGCAMANTSCRRCRSGSMRLSLLGRMSVARERTGACKEQGFFSRKA